MLFSWLFLFCVFCPIPLLFYHYSLDAYLFSFSLTFYWFFVSFTQCTLILHVFFIYAIPHMCGWLACCRGKPSHSADTALPQELLNHSDVKWGPVLSHLCAYHQSTDSLFISTPWSGGRHPRSHWTLGLLPPEMMVSSLNSPITTNYSNTHKIDAHHDKTEYRNLIFT